MLETGTKAPDFTLPDQDGVLHILKTIHQAAPSRPAISWN